MNRFIYLITDPRPNFLDIIVEYLKLGVKWIQYRDKKIDDFNFIKTANVISHLCKKYKAKFIINDRTHLLPQINCEGFHIGQEDGDLESLRKAYPNHIMGVSIHNFQEAKIALKYGADILGVGAIFPTTTKKNAQFTSLHQLEKISKLTSNIAIIGGINLHNISNINPLFYKYIAVSSFLLDSKNYSQNIFNLLNGEIYYAQNLFTKHIFKKIKTINKITSGYSSNLNYLITTWDNQKYGLKLFKKKTMTLQRQRILAKYYDQDLIFVSSKYLIKKWLDGLVCSLSKKEEVFLAINEISKIHNYKLKVPNYNFEAYKQWEYKLDVDVLHFFKKLKKQIKKYSSSIIHGDINSKNIILNKKNLQLIDLEWVCYGPSILDYGYLLSFTNAKIKHILKRVNYKFKELIETKIFVLIHTLLWCMKEESSKVQILKKEIKIKLQKELKIFNKL